MKIPPAGIFDFLVIVSAAGNTERQYRIQKGQFLTVAKCTNECYRVVCVTQIWWKREILNVR